MSPERSTSPVKGVISRPSSVASRSGTAHPPRDAVGQERSDSDLPEWLDGPGLVKWLEDQGFYKYRVRERLAQHWRDWARGNAASVWTVDEVLVHFGLHLSQLPDDLWIGRPGNQGFSPHFRARVVEEVQAGAGRNATARKYGVSPTAVKTWIRAASK